MLQCCPPITPTHRHGTCTPISTPSRRSARASTFVLDGLRRSRLFFIAMQLWRAFNRTIPQGYHHLQCHWHSIGKQAGGGQGLRQTAPSTNKSASHQKRNCNDALFHASEVGSHPGRKDLLLDIISYVAAWSIRLTHKERSHYPQSSKRC